MAFDQPNHRYNTQADPRPLKAGDMSKEPSLFTPQPVFTILMAIPNAQKADHNLTEGFSTTQKFLIHKNLICHYSPFFSAAFSSHFIEDQPQSMTFDDINPTVFGSIVHWLYHPNIATDVDIE
ncbi:hypothetical protein ONS95_005164 [Cadophora gregata]|uniref:uncharacterized protein n=1 Tax=Cadophora gregata TaxID=51156 RepID=UPI0026DDBBA9|nr:uncharacterized protein ONS95_005164 [Cadophora gregata]KAK0104899.1 hypothetical protein ONS95_005164 [Cadophora gregata]KAK0115022.1 hypothetical protein ONS96_013492 [Cadophora gregata f. sp. sojae]